MLLEEKKSIFVAWVTIFWVFRLERLLQKWAYENPLAMSKMRVFVVIFYYWMPSTIRNSLFDKKIKKKTNKKKKLRQSAYRLSHKTEIKVIKTAYQKKGRYLQEPMRTWVKKQPNCLKRGKTRATNWFNVCIWLVERAAQMFWTYMYQKRSKAKTMQSHNFFFSSSLRNCTM